MHSVLEQAKIGSILFATDLSENADRAFAYAVSLADAYQADVTVLHVFGQLPPNADLLLVSFLGYGSIEELHQKSEAQLMDRIKQRIERFCTDVAEGLPSCRFVVKTVLVETGKASERILHHAHSGAYDALVMGSRGHGLVQEVLMGGTSRKVLRDCRIPVLTVPMRGK